MYVTSELVMWLHVIILKFDRYVISAILSIGIKYYFVIESNLLTIT